jgi:hypothetical protein
MAPKYPYIARGTQKYRVARSKTFNIDNGSGVTDDDVLFSGLSTEAQIISAKAVYVEATDTTGAEVATIALGTTAGGVDIVAATALTAAKAVGDAVSYTLAASRIAAGGTLFARHTGVAETEVGQYYMQVVYQVKP